MTDENDTQRDLLVLVQALYNILHESDEPEVIRMAMAALTNTRAGYLYLSSHPIQL